MGNKFLKLILLLFLCSSLILYTHAVPSSRSFINPDHKQDPSAQSLFSQGKVELSDFDWEVAEGRKLQGGRMDIELQDYPGPGANKNHDPRDPGNSG